MLNKLDMVPPRSAPSASKDFVRRLRWKGPVFQISALTREGCEPLVRAIYEHVKTYARRGAGRARPALRCERFVAGDDATTARGAARHRAMSATLRDARRIVVKVGSSLVTNEGRGVDAGGHRRLVPADGGAASARAARW